MQDVLSMASIIPCNLCPLKEANQWNIRQHGAMWGQADLLFSLISKTVPLRAPKKGRKRNNQELTVTAHNLSS